MPVMSRNTSIVSSRVMAPPSTIEMRQTGQSQFDSSVPRNCSSRSENPTLQSVTFIHM